MFLHVYKCVDSEAQIYQFEPYANYKIGNQTAHSLNLIRTSTVHCQGSRIPVIISYVEQLTKVKKVY